MMGITNRVTADGPHLKNKGIIGEILDRNKIYQGHAMAVQKQLPAESIDCVMTSPPYWGLRAYGSEPQIWSASGESSVLSAECEHEWGNELSKHILRGKNSNEGRKEVFGNSHLESGNFCIHCGAWKGELGLEPTYELYIQHLCDVFDETKRVLKPTGTLWVNIGDSYYGGKGQSGARDSEFQEDRFERGESLNKGYHQGSGGKGKYRPADMPQASIQHKSLVLIPERFAIEMVNRGWILRNTIIWYKRNCMPSSRKDGFTVDFEYLFFFVKSNDAQFWVNGKRKEVRGKKPDGIKGIENIDWEWIECPRCKGVGSVSSVSGAENTKIPEEDAESYGSPRARNHRNTSSSLSVCARCKGTGKVQKNLWSGMDYYFEQQFEGAQDWGTRERIDFRNGTDDEKLKHRGLKDANCKETGRNKRCVWDITTKGYPEAHFATYPEELCETPIKAGCPEKICNKCGLPVVKVWEKGELVSSGPNEMAIKPRGFAQNKLIIQDLDKDPWGDMPRREKIGIGYATCNCVELDSRLRGNDRFIRGIVMDPFAGSGTTLAVAKRLGRDYIGVELNPKYIPMIEKRLKFWHKKPVREKATPKEQAGLFKSS